MDYSKIKTYNKQPVKVMSYREAITEIAPLVIFSISMAILYIILAA